jgi:hypothetical protein
MKSSIIQPLAEVTGPTLLPVVFAWGVCGNVEFQAKYVLAGFQVIDPVRTGERKDDPKRTT